MSSVEMEPYPTGRFWLLALAILTRQPPSAPMLMRPSTTATTLSGSPTSEDRPTTSSGTVVSSATAIRMHHYTGPMTLRPCHASRQGPSVSTRQPTEKVTVGLYGALWFETQEFVKSLADRVDW